MKNSNYAFAIITLLFISFFCLCGCEHERHGYFRKTDNGAVNSISMEFFWIRPGTFIMGSLTDETGRSDDEIPHLVTLSEGFYMQTTEVTQAQWKAVMGADNNPSAFWGVNRDNHPVENVSWNKAQEFIEKLNEKGTKRKIPLAHRSGMGICMQGRNRNCFLLGLTGK